MHLPSLEEFLTPALTEQCTNIPNAFHITLFTAPTGAYWGVSAAPLSVPVGRALNKPRSSRYNAPGDLPDQYNFGKW